MKRIIFGALVAASFAMPALAESQITITDSYARAAGAAAMAGAAFFVIENTGDEDDRLIGAASDAAARVELHTHVEGEGGVMRMMQVEDGFPVAAGSTHALQRGGDHVMFMGLTGPWEQGDIIHLTLTFEKAGDIELDVPVDLTREPGMGAMTQGGMSN